MNKVGIIVAMEEEQEEILKLMTNIEEKEIYGVTFKIGNIENNKVIVAKCGVGKVNAARVTQILIDNLKVKCIINVGAAGALNPLLNIGDIVIGEKLIQHDFDITAFDHDKGYITGVGDYLYSDSSLIKKFENSAKALELEEKLSSIQTGKNKLLENQSFKVIKGIIATGDIFCTDIMMKNKIYAKFNRQKTVVLSDNIQNV